MTSFSEKNLEFRVSNFNYGHSLIIKKYSGINLNLPLPFLIQHGWNSFVSTPHYYLNSEFECFWAWNKDSFSSLRKNSPTAKILIGGAPFIYLYDEYKRKNNYDEKNKRGTIVFPAHSSWKISVITNFEKYAEMLDNLPSEFKPITVSFHLKDIELNHHLPFEKKGFDIVVNGDHFSENFLMNFIINSARKKFAISNSIGTASFYAAYIGLDVIIYGPKYEYYNHSDKYFPKGKIKPIINESKVKRLKKIFSFNGDYAKKRKVSQEELGVFFKKTPEEIVSFFDSCINIKYLKSFFYLLEKESFKSKVENAIIEIKKYERIVVAGAGKHTEILLSKYPELRKKTIVILDREKEFQMMGINVVKENRIKEYDYDLLLISSEVYELDIYCRLINLGVDKSKIYLIYNKTNF